MMFSLLLELPFHVKQKQRSGADDTYFPYVVLINWSLIQTLAAKAMKDKLQYNFIPKTWNIPSPPLIVKLAAIVAEPPVK
jgi:hypothetical protein